MKITKTEKIWLGAFVLFFALYNLPFVPSYGDSVGTIIHGAATIIPLWIITYIGFFRVNRLYRPKEDGSASDERSDKQGGE